MNVVTEERPAHSPLGASGAERWMHCPGSVTLLNALTLPQSDESDYQKAGTAAHEIAAKALCFEKDAWEFIGEKTSNGVEVDTEITDAVQLYLDTVKPVIDQCAPGRQVMIEYPLSAPDFHHDFYGTVDLAVVIRGDAFHGEEILDVTDYKHGQGIVVDVENNPQLMYYAYGILREHSEVNRVRLRIVQPRAFHSDGPVRVWETSAENIRTWADNTLLPAMRNAELDSDLDPGPWCRFCPAKLVCPMLTHLFGAAATSSPKEIINLNDAALARSYQYIKAVDFYVKALKDEALRRLNTGVVVAGIKLVHQKANRVLKTGAEEVFKARFGEACFSAPEFKSAAQLEKIGSDAKELVREWAYTPTSTLTVALEDDPRPAVKVATAAETFGVAIAAMKAQDDDLDIPAFLKREKSK